MKIERVISNKVQCLSCNDVIESTRGWEIVTCKCGAVSVDGGTGDLSRRVYKPGAKWRELSETDWVDRESASLDAVQFEDERRAASLFSSQLLTDAEIELVSEFRAGFSDAMNARRALVAVRQEIGENLRYIDLVKWFVSTNICLANRKPIELWKTDRAKLVYAAKEARWTLPDLKR